MIYSTKQIAAMLNITPARVRQIAQSGRAGTNVGGAWAFDDDDVKRLKDRRPGRPRTRKGKR